MGDKFFVVFNYPVKLFWAKCILVAVKILFVKKIFFYLKIFFNNFKSDKKINSIIKKMVNVKKKFVD